ncbi:MAG: 5-deoxy-glucuronate isomerase [Anaerolineales bacterium]
MTESRLLIHPDPSQAEYLRLTPERAGWEMLHVGARRMAQGQGWTLQTGEHEYALVVLGGVCFVRSSRGEWPIVGRRPDVFHGMPYALYLPRQTDVEVQALSSAVDLAYGWCAVDEDHPVRLVRPADVPVEIRGGGNATRQINAIIPPGFACQRLVCVEVYTPPGNWSSYPPHKHDEHRVGTRGEILEADLEEVYLYKLDRPGGFAIQRVYTSDGRLDETIVARHDDLVLVPEGYHPVVSGHGYTTYYLNFLAGSAQSLANRDDPAHAWVKGAWKEKDPRVPLVTLAMEAG